MTVYALWNGGASYAPSYLAEHAEVFPDVDAARDALASRARMGHSWPQTFTYADGREVNALTPCADAGAHMLVYLSDPREVSDPYPDLLLEWDDETESVRDA